MKEIILKMSSPKEALQFASIILQNGFKAYKATISYDSTRKLPVKIRKLSDYPLILEGFLNKQKTRIAITPLSVGNFSDGSYALRQILRVANFNVEDKDLFTMKNFNRQTGYLHMTILQK